MKKVYQALVCLACILLLCSCKPKIYAPRFQYWENNKFGYIDQQGKVIIPARFDAAQDFSEGVAAVREGGYYGYIDTEGEWIVPAAYDYAAPFSEGLALVYKNGKASFIRRDGKEMFKADYLSIGSFHFGRAIVRSWNKRFGMIDRKGNLVLDTIYKQVDPTDGRYFILSPSRDSECVVDAKGALILPYRNHHLTYVGEGCFLAYEYDTSLHQPVNTLIDSTGKELFRINGSDISIESTMSAGRLIYERWVPEREARIHGIISSNGKIIYADSTIRDIVPFYGNRSFIRKKDAYQVITRDGKIIGPDFDNVLYYDGFKGNVAFVEKGLRWGMIDTNASYIVRPKFDQIMEPGLVGNVFFFQAWSGNTSSNGKFGIADKSGKIILKACLDEYDADGFRNGLLSCRLSNKMTYVNEAGKIVWQEKTDSLLRPLNIDYMQRGYCCVMSESDLTKRPWVYGGRPLLPLPQKITAGKDLAADSLCLRVAPNSKDTFDNRYKGLSVFIYNNTAAPVEFDVQDYRLYMKMQAFVDNKWTDIEYLPSSWCGNSYHTVTLPPKKYWQLKCPVYEGIIKTKLRIRLVYQKSKDEDVVIYSNEFDGHINPGQLWRKEGHQPVNIMDPYVE